MKLEIFFDYLCEFCEMGMRDLRALLPAYPQARLCFRPCEAHPREEEPFGRHSDLAIQGMLILGDRGGNLARYNEEVFEAVWRRGENIEDPAVLARCAVQAGGDPRLFMDALGTEEYVRRQRENNRYAYGSMRVRAVPTYLCGGLRADAVLGVGVSRRRLARMLRAAAGENSASAGR